MLISGENIRFKAVRSGGPGGQNVNRRSTKVQLWVKLNDLPLTDFEKKRVREKLAHHINKEDELWVKDEEERNQEQNREKAMEHLNQMLEEALQMPLPRIPTEVPRNAENARIHDKKMTSVKKRARREI